MFEHLYPDIKAHAAEEYPSEACGVIVSNAYVRCVNTHPEPEKAFRLEDKWLLALGIQAIVHSHPDGPDWPSEQDMKQQMSTALPWAIVLVEKGFARDPFWFGDQVPVAPLIGRTFRHGVHDCYAGVRDYFRLSRDVVLPDLPRECDWWYKGGNILNENFEKFGFRRIDSGEMQEGDCVMASILCPGITNHSGVYVGNGLVFHHMYNRLSREEPLGPWMKYVTHFLRYEP